MGTKVSKPQLVIVASLALCSLCWLYYALAYTQLAGLFILSSSIQFFAMAIWTVFIYPHFISPLRHLPQAKNGHWLLGHAVEARKKSVGALARKW